MQKVDARLPAQGLQGQNIVAGNYAMAFDDYLAYMDGASADEMPLYLFDCKFAAKAPSLAADYSVSGALIDVLLLHAPPSFRSCTGLNRDFKVVFPKRTANSGDWGAAGAGGVRRGPLCRPGGAGPPRLQVNF